MGKHFLLNLYGCSFSTLDDEVFLKNLLKSSAIASGATVIETISSKFEPQGCTVICLLSESHLSIHTWPENGTAAVDCYTCGNSDPRVACDLIISKTNPTEYKMHFIQR